MTKLLLERRKIPYFNHISEQDAGDKRIFQDRLIMVLHGSFRKRSLTKRSELLVISCQIVEILVYCLALAAFLWAWRTACISSRFLFPLTWAPRRFLANFKHLLSFDTFNNSKQRFSYGANLEIEKKRKPYMSQ